MIIKNAGVERHATEVARLAGETRMEAIRRALEERRARLSGPRTATGRQAHLLRVLEEEIWPALPASVLGTPALTRKQRQEQLGYGPEVF